MEDRVAELATELAHGDPDARRRVAYALGDLGLNGLPTLITVVGDPHPAVRRSAVVALGIIGPQAVLAVPALITTLRDPDPSVRASAVRSLGEMVAVDDLGPASAEVVRVVAELLNDLDADVRLVTIQTLGRIGPAAAAALPALMEVLRSRTTIRVRDAVGRAIARIGLESAPPK
jgi:HEAT repeat protein